MFWTVDPGQLREFWAVELEPSLMLVNVQIQGATIGGTVGQILYVRLPFAKIAAHRSDAMGLGFDNALFTTIGVFTQAGDARLGIVRSDLANWTAGTMSAHFQITVRTVAPR